MYEQSLVFATLGMTLVLFVTGSIRYDLVALLALLFLTVIGIIPAEEAFLGFGNPAVVTVAAVLVISRSLENAGLVAIIGEHVAKVGSNITAQVAALTLLVTVLSAFINNVGALALMMPVAIQLARKHERSPSFLLMPMAFGSLLGGMSTLIGTPPNLIISDFRRSVTGEPFSMFDFSYVGAIVAAAGLVFIALIGWRMVPRRRGHGSRRDLFKIEDYLSEVVIGEASPLIGNSIRDSFDDDSDIVIAGLVREKNRLGRLSTYVPLRADDVLIVRANPEALAKFIEDNKLTLSGEKATEEELASQETCLVEAVVNRYSKSEHRTAKGMRLAARYGVNLLAISRRGRPVEGRLGTARFQSGDILLLQMPEESLAETLGSLGLLPLAERSIKIGRPRRLLLALTVFAAALIASSFGWLPSAVSFSVAVLLLVMTSVIDIKEAYESVDWSIVILLGAMIPVGKSLETTGGAGLIADTLLSTAGGFSPAIILGLVLVTTMFLSDLINNAAAAIVMAPVSISIANGMEASIDPFLLATAIGASCAFLTPIGHQSNTIVMGPGGYRFGDYWKMGIVLELIIAAVSIPLLLYFWPMFPEGS